MTLSIWRYSHLTLAISSFLFIIVASITGIILAFEPISNQLKPHSVSDLSTISIANMVVALEKEYEEIIAVEIDNNNFVIASVITKQGESKTFYIHPKTGETISDVIPKASIYKFATTLHRSLFLKSLGRFFVGLVSFLLCLIVISGGVLILKRQGSLQQFFTKVTWENFYQYFHVVLGRFSLLPLLIITLTGVYLSLEKFNLLPKEKIQHNTNAIYVEDTSRLNLSEFEILKNTKLSVVKKIEFPFSDDVEDYFLLQLRDKEIMINQITGTIVSEVDYPFTKLASYYSLILHTGQGSIFWSVILALTCLATLFFIYSGFFMTFQRIKGNVKNKYKKDDCEYIILVGSENGNTKNFAKMLYKAILNENKKVFVTNLNAYTSFKSIQHLIVLTATYGDGEAPSNASNFLRLIANSSLNSNPFNFSVVAFGSLSYPKFCQFGIDVNAALEEKENANQLLSIYKIHNQSFEVFSTWTQEFSKCTDLNLRLDKRIISKRKKTILLTLEKKVDKGKDDTFLLKFNCTKKFTSGDLLGIYPGKNLHERLYSIAEIEKSLVLSVKRHEFGMCSNYLYNLNEGDSIEAFIQKNRSFHFPKQASKVIMIATGTGIAPFLGMINNNTTTPIDVYFGVRNKQSLTLYEGVLHLQKLANVFFAFSRETNSKKYVQDSVQENLSSIISDLQAGAVIMICGAIQMQKDIFNILDKELVKNNKSLSFYENRNQILVDCY